jgi:hypothetical protein
LLHAYSASAFFSSGKIDDDFSYRSLNVEKLETKTKRDGCYLVGEILNNTNVIQEDVSITFYAFDFFGHSLWKEIVHIDIIDPFFASRKGRLFHKKLSRCDMPAKFQFKVSGVKKNDTKKVIPAKSKSKLKDSDSRHSLPKSDFKEAYSIPKNIVPDSATPSLPVRKCLITLTNGKEITTDSCREHDNMVFYYKDGGEVQISKDKVHTIRKQE